MCTDKENCVDTCLEGKFDKEEVKISDEEADGPDRLNRFGYYAKAFTG